MEYGRSYNQQNDYNQTHILMGIASENDELYQSKEKRLRMSTSVIEIHIPTAYVARKGSFWFWGEYLAARYKKRS